MDINSLLSPTGSTASESGAPPGGTTPTTSHVHFPAPTSTPVSRSSPGRSLDSPTTSHHSAMPSPPVSDFAHRKLRPASTPGMDTLADVASMQYHQQTTRASPSGLRKSETYERTPLPTNIRPSLQEIARTHSGSRSSLDIRMADAPAQTPPLRSFNAPSLSEAQRQRVSELVSDLAKNPHAYESHVELIRLLYEGFIAHVFPESPPAQGPDAFSYELLGELRQALEAMSSRFALGEELWQAKLRMSELTAANAEDCVTLMESFEKAVGECPASTAIWSMYGNWSLALYSSVQPSESLHSHLAKPHDMPLKLSEEDSLVLSEVSTTEQMMDVWRRGAEDTKYRIDSSALVWDTWLDLQRNALGQSRKKAEIEHVSALFGDRLSVPHRTWDDTFQKFSNFISVYQNKTYEDTMVSASRQGQVAKNACGEREAFEIRIRLAVDSNDVVSERSAFHDYIAWELSRNRKKGLFNFNLANALFQRYALRFPSDVNGWEDYLTFFGDEASPPGRSRSQLTVLDRACNHCPWSGSLWSLYIQAAESEGLDFADLSQIKHKATSTGLLDAGSMEEVLMVHTALCGFLRRQAFRQRSNDEELDIAEMGILSSMEDMETLGKEKYGANYQGDPQYRLERIYIKFLVQARNYGGARDTWRKLISRHGNSYEFWLRYYAWEMLMWAMMLNPEAATAASQTPTDATAVLRLAIQQPNLDWPEKVIETYLSHCEDHENVEELQTAILQCRRAAKLVNKRREREAQQVAEQAQAQAAASTAEEEQSSTKRKREDDEHGSSKKSKGETDVSVVETNIPAKRDRENATVLVRNLPVDVSEKHIRHFFNECGTIKSLNLLERDGNTTATLEFESKEDALSAQTKDQKLFRDKVLEVSIGTGTTLYVTNFPPTADEAYIRELFGAYGDITSIRFPSLKYSTHRRFCYVQFADAEHASSASSALDGSSVGDEGLRLLAKLSDPAHKQARHGAMAEGREVFVSNVDWTATEEDMSKLFGKYGSVERVRMPRKMDGKSKGMAFIIFATQQEAQAALDLDATKYKTRILTVQISTSNPSKRQATVFGAGAGGASTGERISASPDAASPSGLEGDASADAGSTVSQRTLALLDIPDTVNAARLQALANKHGVVKRTKLMADRGGAIVEFASVADAGAAALALEGLDLDGAPIRVGTPAELHAKRPRNAGADVSGAAAASSRDKPSASNAKSKTTGKSNAGSSAARLAAPPPAVRRPGLGATRGGGGGRRGGLGQKKMPVPRAESGDDESAANANGHGDADAKPNGGGAAGGRSNDDFRAMFTKDK